MPLDNAVQTYYNKILQACTLNTIRRKVTSYVADGALSTSGAVAKLTKGSAGAYTLAAPTAAQEGQELVIVAGTAFAHVITASNLLDDGVTGGAKDTATFAAFVGASITLIACDLKWIVVSKNLVTIAAV